MRRGRKLTVVNRLVWPTGDRVRETLLTGSRGDVTRCLDLFAGSGGLDWRPFAATSCEFVDADEQALLSIRNNLSGIERDPAPDSPATVLSTAAEYLAGEHKAWDTWPWIRPLIRV